MANTKRSNKSYVSSGERRSVVNGRHRKSDWTPLEQLNFKVKAWQEGKNVVLVMPNSNPNETKKPFVRKNAKEVWGTYKKFSMKGSVDEQ